MQGHQYVLWPMLWAERSLSAHLAFCVFVGIILSFLDETSRPSGITQLESEPPCLHGPLAYNILKNGL